MEIQMPLVLFTLLAGAGGGTMVFLCLSEFFGFGTKITKTACYVIAGLLVAGGICSVFHLAQKMHVMAAVLNIGSFSGISMELIGLTVSFVLLVLYWLFCRDGQSKSARRVIAVLCGIAGLAFCYIQGSSYVIEARPYWNTILLPLGYWGSGLGIGSLIFLSTMVALKQEPAHIKRIAQCSLAALAIQTLLYIAYGVSAGSASLVDNGILFWGIQLVCGCLVPLLIVAAVLKGKDVRLVYVALACALLGGIAYRAMMWILGIGEMPSLFDTAANNRSIINW